MLTHSYTYALTDVLFDQSDEFIGIYDPIRQWFVRVNEAGYRLFGYASESDFLAQPDRRFRAQPITETYRQLMLRQLDETGHYAEETDLYRADGQTFWGKVRIWPLHHDGQQQLVVRVTDQEHIRAMEQQLEHSARRYEAVYSNATIGIIVSDGQGRMVSVNAQAERLFGYDADAMLGQPIEILVPNAVERRHEHLRHSFYDNPQVRAMGHNRDLHAQRNDGSVFPVEISLSYFRLDEELYVVAYIVDITYKKNAERELIEQKERIERLNAELEQKVVDRTHALMMTLEQLEASKDELARALAAERELGELKSRFVSMASHEFRTPLTTVLTSASLIEKYPTTEQQDKRLKHLQRIRASVNHLNDILEEFLSVGRLEEGRVEMHPARVAIGPLLDEVVADLQGMTKAGQTVQTTVTCPAVVRTDPSLLRKIIVNLLSNALKYSGERTVVTVTADCAGNRLQLRVSDQGIGIANDDQERLFERFFRAKNVTNIQGTGLGLHIVAKYLELLGGTISLDSELGRGTTVTITMPYEDDSVD